MKVSGIFKSGLYEIDNGTILTNLKTSQRVFGYKNRVNLIQVFIDDIFNSEQIAIKIKKNGRISKLVGFIESRVITWKDMNASLFSALEFEKTILFFTLTLIIIVASLNIIAGLILLVIQKMKDIGILLSYGASPKIIRNIFFIQGGIIGVIGTFLGTFIGIVFCHIANRFELFKIPSDIYQMGHINFNTDLKDILLVIFVSLIISFTATIIPSLKAAKINVIDAVKNE
jgi:lipoprotein-releasing system permease protein